MRVVLLVALALIALTAVAGCGGGKEEVVVPYVTGLREQLASNVVEDAGLRARVYRSQKTDFPKGVVYDQSPREGSSAERDSELSIWVTSGTG